MKLINIKNILFVVILFFSSFSTAHAVSGEPNVVVVFDDEAPRGHNSNCFNQNSKPIVHVLGQSMTNFLLFGPAFSFFFTACLEEESSLETLLIGSLIIKFFSDCLSEGLPLRRAFFDKDPNFRFFFLRAGITEGVMFSLYSLAAITCYVYYKNDYNDCMTVIDHDSLRGRVLRKKTEDECQSLLPSGRDFLFFTGSLHLAGLTIQSFLNFGFKNCDKRRRFRDQ